jgi:hypothetical protein
MGGHSSGHFVPQYSDYNFTGKAHLMGEWEGSNNTADLQQLRKQILTMQKAYDNVVSPANIAKTILGQFKGFNPFNLLKHSSWCYCSSVFMFIQSNVA